MIESFRHDGLQEMLVTGRSAKVPTALRRRVKTRLDALNAISELEALRGPALDLHPLATTPERWAIRVVARWVISFDWTGNDAREVDLVEEPVN